MSFPSNVISFPLEVQQLILQKVDAQSLLNTRASCQSWQAIVDIILQNNFKTKYHLEDYVALSPQKFSFGERSLMNIRVGLAAKKAWESPLATIQYKKIAPRQAHEMGQPIHPSPVKVTTTSANAVVLYSDEGSRWQKSTLWIKSDDPFTVRTKSNSPTMKEFSLQNIGLVEGAWCDGNNLVFLTKNLDSYFLVLQDLSFEEPEIKIPLDVNTVTCHFFTQGKLYIGNKSGELFEFTYDDDKNVSLGKKRSYASAFDWIGILPDQGLVLRHGSELCLDYPNKARINYPITGLTGTLAISGNSVIALKEDGTLISLKPQSSLLSTTIREDVASFLPLDDSQYLITTSDRQLESWIGDLRIASHDLGRKMSLTAASRQNGLLAVALSDIASDKEEVVVFAENMEQLTKIYTKPDMQRRNGVNALHFTQTFELLITTNDGSILTVLPFPIEREL